MAEKSIYFFQDVTEYDEKAERKFLNDDGKAILKAIHELLSVLAEWQDEAIHAVMTAVAEDNNLKLGKVAQPIRVAITGNTVSPPLGETLQELGRDATLKRLSRCL